jgi:predicted 3-demethylubiquinone-9 3-methyltransferase (glyoxalase superfamily)
MSKITPFLWFDDQAEEAMNFYVSIFPDSRVLSVTHLGDVPGPQGKALVATFQLAGQQFMALNGGPGHPFTDAVSLFVNCQTQDEVDDLWEKLTEGGEPGPCGWLKDRYGVSWQVVPAALGELMGDPDPEKAARVTRAMLQMSKIDVAALRRAYAGP